MSISTSVWGSLLACAASAGPVSRVGRYSAFWLALLACGSSDVEPTRTTVAPPDTPNNPTTRTGLSRLDQEDAGDAASDLCVVEPPYLARRKACSADTDCALFTYRPDCCPNARVVGIARADLAQAQACADTNTRVCVCDPLPKRAEDGRAVNHDSQAVARCIKGRCTSSVSERNCGAHMTCGPDQLCVSYGNIPGGIPPDPDSGDNAYLTFRCVPNPCDNHLGCDCAQPLCDARNDAIRKCEIERNTESDVACVPYRN